MAQGPEVLLIQPMQCEGTREAIFQPGVEIPLNLTSLAGYLRMQGIDSKIIDLRVWPGRTVEESIRTLKPKVAGITAFSSEFPGAVKLAREIRALDPEISIVVGGYHATAEPDETLRTRAFDYAVIGEGEVAFHQFVQARLDGQELKGLPGLGFMDGDDIVMNARPPQIKDLDDLPLTPRDMLDLSLYVPSPGTGNFMRLPTTGIMASRGCPYTCRYCSKGSWGTAVRYRSVPHLLREVEQCIETYGIHDFRFYDDILPLKKKWMREFCETVIERKIDISWNCYNRVDLGDAEILKLMAAAGCYHIKYGIEFGTEMSLDFANKRTNLEQTRAAVRNTKAAGIECKGNFILGAPGETVERARETIRFAIEISPDLAAFYPFIPIPGSEWGARYKRDAEFANLCLPIEERVKLVREAYRRFYLRPAYIAQRLHQIVLHPVRDIRLTFNAMKMLTSYAIRMTFERITRPFRGALPSVQTQAEGLAAIG